MKCASCGKDNPNNANFCTGCGAKLGNTQNEDAQVNAQPEQKNAQPEQTNSQQQQAQQQNQQGQTPTNPQQQQQFNNQQQQTYQSQQVPQSGASFANYSQYGAKSAFQPKSDNIDDKQYTSSPFGSGWADISNSDGWVGRSVLLGLCSIVPILRWVVYGFAARWGREVCLGINRRLPSAIFEEGTFVTGAKIWVCNLAYSAIFCFAFFLLILIPFLGPIVFIVALVIYALISPLLDFQIGLSGKISAGFTGIARACKLLKKTPIKTLASTFAPALIIEGFVSVVFIAIFFILLFAFTGQLFADATSSMMNVTFSNSGSKSAEAVISNAIASNIGFLTSNLFLVIIACFAYTVGEALSNVWSARAIGHLVSREATDWLCVEGLTDRSNTNLDPNETPNPFVPFQNK